jgi:hypothetical protein
MPGQPESDARGESRRYYVFLCGPVPHSQAGLAATRRCLSLLPLSGREPGSHIGSLDSVRYGSLPFLFLPVRVMQKSRTGANSAVTNVLNRTYKAMPTVHSHRLPGSESRYSGLEDYVVRYMTRYISSLFLTAAIAAPTAIMAHPRPQEGSVQVRIYDRDHRDYHDWDDHEDRAYRRYLTAQHRTYREYHRQHHREQRHYWNWRHTHPDRD